jgi:hypothetical protein
MEGSGQARECLALSAALLQNVKAYRGALLHRIAGIESPHELSVSQNRNFAFVTSDSSDSKSLTIVDLRRRVLQSEVQLSPYRRLGGMHVGESGNIYVTAAEQGALLIIDPLKGRERPFVQLTQGDMFVIGGFSPSLCGE